MNVQQAVLADVSAIVDLQERIIAEKQYFISTAEAFSAEKETLREQVAAIITQTEQSAIVFVAKLGKKIVGAIIFRSSTSKRLAHRGSFSIYVHPDYRHKGIGTQLLQVLIQRGEEHPIIEKLCLGVFSTNQSAIQLYKKMGFIEEGRKVKDIKLANDKYIDDVLMYKLV